MEQIYLNRTLKVIARLPCVEMRLPIFSCLHSCLVALVCPAGGFILLRSSKVFDLSRQIVCSFVTLGHSGLGWAQSQQGRRRRRKIFCTILNSSAADLVHRPAELFSKTKRSFAAAAMSGKVGSLVVGATRRPAILRQSSGPGSDFRRRELGREDPSLMKNEGKMVTDWPWPLKPCWFRGVAQLRLKMKLVISRTDNCCIYISGWLTSKQTGPQTIRGCNNNSILSSDAFPWKTISIDRNRIIEQLKTDFLWAGGFSL